MDITRPIIPHALQDLVPAGLYRLTAETTNPAGDRRTRRDFSTAPVWGAGQRVRVSYHTREGDAMGWVEMTIEPINTAGSTYYAHGRLTDTHHLLKDLTPAVRAMVEAMEPVEPTTAGEVIDAFGINTSARHILEHLTDTGRISMADLKDLITNLEWPADED